MLLEASVSGWEQVLYTLSLKLSQLASEPENASAGFVIGMKEPWGTHNCG